MLKWRTTRKISNISWVTNIISSIDIYAIAFSSKGFIMKKNIFFVSIFLPSFDHKFVHIENIHSPIFLLAYICMSQSIEFFSMKSYSIHMCRFYIFIMFTISNEVYEPYLKGEVSLQGASTC